MLKDVDWYPRYSTEHGNLAELFYIPALENASRYDRQTGYFSAGALTQASRGIESLVRNGGTMRLISGCTLDANIIHAIKNGLDLRESVESRMLEFPPTPTNASQEQALELLAWMVRFGHLNVKVAVPRLTGDSDRTMSNDIDRSSLFHAKAGVIEDADGSRIAWEGSNNETEAGWGSNAELFSIHCDWWEGRYSETVDQIDSDFQRLWENNSRSNYVLDIPEAVRQNLLEYEPKDGAKPRRLVDHRQRVWAYIKGAASRDNGTVVGNETAPVTPWPHQLHAFERMYSANPTKLLVADEVGLGKTIQAGLYMRQAVLAGRVRRALILAPKALLNQWQLELKEKFNLNWPIYTGMDLRWLPTMNSNSQRVENVSDSSWLEHPYVITSSQLVRRSDRALELIESESTWDLIVLDEAHHARRKADSPERYRPNALLDLMNQLATKTASLLLLTATPLQMRSVELWDLMNLLGLPEQWDHETFDRFHEKTRRSLPDRKDVEELSGLFRAVESFYGEKDVETLSVAMDLKKRDCQKLLRDIKADSDIPRRQWTSSQIQDAFKVIRHQSPVQCLVSRHTRATLRKYHAEGKLELEIANRKVSDRFITMSSKEFALYEDVEDYIAQAYAKASAADRNAVGFIMTVYRRRVASSFYALRQTLERRLAKSTTKSDRDAVFIDEDVFEDDIDDELDLFSKSEEELREIENASVGPEERQRIRSLLRDIKRLPQDSKVQSLKAELARLKAMDYGQSMVFTQYTDTMDYLKQTLQEDTDFTLMTYSGRGGEVLKHNKEWNSVERLELQRRFRNGEAEVLLCTDAAAEGLNFQFCGAIINYDMPWNPMKVEQRIGRLDRLGQVHSEIQILNFHYEDTVEADVYRALRERVKLFEDVVGTMQPILANLPKKLSTTVLEGKSKSATDRHLIVKSVGDDVDEKKEIGIELETLASSEYHLPEREPSPVSMTDLERVLEMDQLFPIGTEIRLLQKGNHEYSIRLPKMQEPVRVTTSKEYFLEHSDSVEFWSPGNEIFEKAIPEIFSVDPPEYSSLSELLDEVEGHKATSQV